MQEPLITLSSDFEKQSQGVGNMEGVVHSINPGARVIHLMHGISSFSVVSAARTMETAFFMPIGYHVCVVDPGVGTSRRGLIVKVKRGDYFIGPDNGCLMTAPRVLGGVEKIVSIENEDFMVKPVSPIFHGRHVFAPAAAHLSKGVAMERFGPELKESECLKAPYEDARVKNGKVEATVIHVNHFGSVHLNILGEEWDRLGLGIGDRVLLDSSRGSAELEYATTFGDVAVGKPLIMKDDYLRVEIAVNQGSFVSRVPLGAGEKATIRK